MGLDYLTEDEEYFLPISAISHYLYCPRQAALIYVEQIFDDNILTISGRIGHENVNKPREEKDHGLRKVYSMQVFSEKLKIIGVADVVEFPENEPPLPIDYKHGPIASWKNQEAQVTAVALCLEEMLGVKITTGSIYHIRSKRRRNFLIDRNLRELTIDTIQKLHAMIENRHVPPAKYGRICNRCSLKQSCMPKLGTTPLPNIFTPL